MFRLPLIILLRIFSRTPSFVDNVYIQSPTMRVYIIIVILVHLADSNGIIICAGGNSGIILFVQCSCFIIQEYQEISKNIFIQYYRYIPVLIMIRSKHVVQ